MALSLFKHTLHKLSQQTLTLLPVSAMYTVPFESTATPAGDLSCVVVLPGWPFPTSVSNIWEAILYILMQWFPMSGGLSISSNDSCTAGHQRQFPNCRAAMIHAQQDIRGSFLIVGLLAGAAACALSCAQQSCTLCSETHPVNTQCDKLLLELAHSSWKLQGWHA
jgi:hypothetical protein